MVELIITNINESISFIKNDCTDEELYWMCEVFDDIYEKSKK